MSLNECRIYKDSYTYINFAVLIGIVFLIFKGIKAVKKFINRNKEVDRKLDIILREMEKEKNG